MSLATLVEEAQVEGDVHVVWDSRDVASGTRLQYEAAPLSGYRAIMQDRAGTCTVCWLPDSTPLDACKAALDMYLSILNPE